MNKLIELEIGNQTVALNMSHIIMVEAHRHNRASTAIHLNYPDPQANGTPKTIVVDIPYAEVMEKLNAFE